MNARFCFIILTIMVIAPLAMAEVPAARVTTVVRADARTGRLVRAVAVVPRTVEAVPVAPVPAGAAEHEKSSSNLAEMIDDIAGKHDVESLLVHSVIKAESNYNALAISPKGAQGMMQLIPSTARRFGVKNSFDAEQNIEGGVRYLRYLLDLYHGDYPKAVAAYNAGEKAVDRFGGIPPYAETRNYLYQVARNLKAARRGAELREKKQRVKNSSAQKESAETFQPIVSSVGPDGKVYYRTP